MLVSRRSRPTAEVRVALHRWLPYAEMVTSLLDSAKLVVDVVDDVTGAVRAVGAAVEGAMTLSGAPVMLAVAADDEHAADLLADACLPLAGTDPGIEVHGPGSTATRVVDTMGRMSNGVVEPVMLQRLLVAEDVVVPWSVPGWMRTAVPDDHELLARWMDAFSVEALGGTPHGPEHWMQQVQQASTRMLVWDVGGRVAGMLHSRPTTPVSYRIGPVYTPPEHREQGYAAALTAHATRAALERGCKRVVLFTDVRNETSHGVYTRIGYQDVGPHSSFLLRPHA